MSKILNNVDLGRSFDKLKNSLKEIESYPFESDTPLGVRFAYKCGRLETAISLHLIECTGEGIYTAQNPDDLKQVNI